VTGDTGWCKSVSWYRVVPATESRCQAVRAGTGWWNPVRLETWVTIHVVVCAIAKFSDFAQRFLLVCLLVRLVCLMPESQVFPFFPTPESASTF
jgi:hypothetical protein